MRHSVRLPLDQLRPWLVELPAEPASLSLKTLFDNDYPVELEVGSGKGLFLLTASAARPEVNFLGLEIERKFALYIATRLAKRERRNVRVICADGRAVLAHYLPEACLDAVHVYFPDPWWKNRHRKRRLFTEEFARHCARVVKPAGSLHLATDVEDYFTRMTDVMASVSEFEPVEAPDIKSPEHDFDYLTNFDRKYRKEGRPIFRARYARRSDLSA